MSDQVAHEGQRSEYIQINAQQGSHVHYYYPTAHAPLSEDLTAGVWVKSNRPGIQILARVVLPKEANPASLEDRLTTVIRGDSYRKVGLWQRLALGQSVKLAVEQQQLMQKQLGRSINFHRSGSLKAALTSAGEERMRRDAERAMALGIPAEMISHAEAARLAPHFQPGRARSILYCPEDAWLDPDRLAPALGAN